MKKMAVLFLVLLGMTSALQAKTMYVQSNRATLLEKPTFRSTKLKALPRGTNVQVLETKNRWVKIQSDKQSGWIFKFLLSSNPPVKKVSKYSYKQKRIAPNVRRRASSVTTAGAARGLSADQRKRIGDNDSNYFALEKIEDMEINESEVTHFLNTGPQQP